MSLYEPDICFADIVFNAMFEIIQTTDSNISHFHKITQCEGLRAAAKAYSNQSVMNIAVIR